MFNLANAFDDDEFEEKTPRFTIGDGGGDTDGVCGGDVDFQISSESDGEQGAPTMWMGLSPPGKSSLARRRMLSKGSPEDDDNNSSSTTSTTTTTVMKPRSPPKAPVGIVLIKPRVWLRYEKKYQCPVNLLEENTTCMCSICLLCLYCLVSHK